MQCKSISQFLYYKKFSWKLFQNRITCISECNTVKNIWKTYCHNKKLFKVHRTMNETSKIFRYMYIFYDFIQIISHPIAKFLEITILPHPSIQLNVPGPIQLKLSSKSNVKNFFKTFKISQFSTWSTKYLRNVHFLKEFLGDFIADRRSSTSWSQPMACFLFIFINNLGLVPDLKVAYILKLFKAQSCLTVA